MNALCIHGVRKRFVRHLQGARELGVLSGVDLDVQAGTCTVLKGPSGSGKSSLLRCVYRTYRPDAGSIVLRCGDEHLDLATADDRAVLSARRRLLGLATQFLQITPRVGATDLVAQEGMEHEEAAELLRSLGLPCDLLDVAPATFSGGERQIVNLAITLARPRPVLLLDEVTASLDPARRALALRALAQRRDAGTTLLGVFHDPPDHAGLVDRVLEMRDGRLVAA